MEIQGNISEFVLWGLSDDRHIQIFCFLLLLLCFVALLGNILILAAILCSPLFHQPMYSFLLHLSFMDICYTSSVTPKPISSLLAGTKAIYYSCCMLQVFTLHFFGGIEVLIITAMAFDRYVVICKPLHYMGIMNKSKCHLLILAAWIGGASHSFPQLFVTLQLPFCGPNEIDHYFCDTIPLLKIACADTYIMGVLVVANSGSLSLVVFSIFCVSYAIILFTLRNHSAEGRRKALSTCGSHITVVVLR